jgi:CelD/BcsL family acetyltransferase involved in cellulose biosynthesis
VRPLSAQYVIQSSPVLSLRAGSFDEWLTTKSSNFRSEMRRRRRRFAQAGGTVRLSTSGTVRQDVETFIRLHRGRWEGRGVSSIVRHESQVQALLTEVGETHADDGIFRLVALEIDGKPIAAQVHVAVGGEVLFWNGGWDEEYAEFNPSVLCLLAAIEDAFARGDRRCDLGPGAQPYKLRIADGNDPIAWTLLMLPGARLPLTLARTAPMLAKRRFLGLAKRSLTPTQVDRLRELRTHWRAT